MIHFDEYIIQKGWFNHQLDQFHHFWDSWIFWVESPFKWHIKIYQIFYHRFIDHHDHSISNKQGVFLSAVSLKCPSTRPMKNSWRNFHHQNVRKILEVKDRMQTEAKEIIHIKVPGLPWTTVAQVVLEKFYHPKKCGVFLDCLEQPNAKMMSFSVVFCNRWFGGRGFWDLHDFMIDLDERAELDLTKRWMNFQLFYRSMLLHERGTPFIHFLNLINSSVNWMMNEILYIGNGCLSISIHF